MPPGYRCCVSCRRVIHRQNLWRIVRCSPSQQVQVDQGQGRSVYLCPSAPCLLDAKKHKRLQRSLKTPIPDSIFEVLQGRLSQEIPEIPEQSKKPEKPEKSRFMGKV